MLMLKLLEYYLSLQLSSVHSMYHCKNQDFLVNHLLYNKKVQEFEIFGRDFVQLLIHFREQNLEYNMYRP